MSSSQTSAATGSARSRPLRAGFTTQAEAEAAEAVEGAEALRREHAAKVLEGFRDVNAALRALESDAEALETDLLASTATMSAIEAARRERSMAHMQVLASQAANIRRRVEEEEAAGEAARAMIEVERLEKARARLL